MGDASLRLLFLLGVMEFFVLVPTLGTLFPIYAKDEFAAGPQGLGLMFTAIGIGGVTGGYLAGMLARRVRTGLLQAGAIVGCSLAIVGLALSPTFAVAFVAIVFAGMFEMLLGTANLAAMQMLAPEAMRGRITSLSQIYPAVISLGSLLVGPLADLAGARGASLAAAGICLSGTFALWTRSSRLRELSVSASAPVEKAVQKKDTTA
jgi:ENTS family enterobactin (siderophore) exporter